MAHLRTSCAVMCLGAAVLAAPLAHAEQKIPVTALAAAPTIDGKADDWGDGWLTVPVKPAMEDDNKNFTGELDVQMQAGVAGDSLYLVARWPDDKAHTDYRPWEWKRNQYKRSRDRDDMFAVRFDMAGDFNTCMIEDVNYKVDVWLWSAGRSNEKGYATDMWHEISLDMIKDAAEYETPGGNTVYIRKESDAGTPAFENNKPDRKTHQGDVLPGVVFEGEASGSLADVEARGEWSGGFWVLELRRKLDTGHDDDVVLQAGATKKGQIAVFNKGNAEHKSVSGELVFDFSAL